MALISQSSLGQRLPQSAIDFLEAREKGYTSEDDVETRPLFTRIEYIERGLALEPHQPLRNLWTDSELKILEKLLLEGRLSRFGNKSINIDAMMARELSLLEASRLRGDEEKAAHIGDRVRKMYSMVEELTSTGKVEKQSDGTIKITVAHLDEVQISSSSSDDGSLPDTPGSQPIRAITPEASSLTTAGGANTLSGELAKHEQNVEHQYEQDVSEERVTGRTSPSPSTGLLSLVDSTEETTTMTDREVIDGKGNEAFDATLNTARVTNAESSVPILDPANEGREVSKATHEERELSLKDGGEEENVPESVSEAAEENHDTVHEPRTQAPKKAAKKRQRPKKKAAKGEVKAEVTLSKLRITKESSVGAGTSIELCRSVCVCFLWDRMHVSYHHRQKKSAPH